MAEGEGAASWGAEGFDPEQERRDIAADAADERLESEEQELAGAPGEAAPTSEEVAGENTLGEEQ